MIPCNLIAKSISGMISVGSRAQYHRERAQEIREIAPGVLFNALLEEYEMLAREYEKLAQQFIF